MDQQDIKELLEAMLMKKNKDGNKYPGPDGSVCRWKRQVMRKLGSKKAHNHLLVNRLNKDLRRVKEFIIVKETQTEDKDKNKDKEKDTKKNYIYSQDVDTGVATPKKKIFESNTASEAKKLLTKVKDSPGKYKQHSVVRNPRYLTKHQREEMDIALWDALLDYIDEERYDHLWTHLKRGNVLELWKILDGRAASEPEEYCTALKDRIKTKNFDDNDIKTTEHFGRWFSDTVELYKQLTNSARNSGQVKLIHLYSENEFVKDIINKIGNHIMSIKDDYIRDCRNGKKWDLERLRNRIQYMQIKGELKDERDERFRASSLQTRPTPWTTARTTTTTTTFTTDDTKSNGTDNQGTMPGGTQDSLTTRRKTHAKSFAVHRSANGPRNKTRMKTATRNTTTTGGGTRRGSTTPPTRRGGAAPATTTANKNGDARRTTRLTAVSTRRSRPTRTRTTPTES